MVRKFKVFGVAAMASLSMANLTSAQGILTQWNFPTGFSTTSPVPSLGSGTASLIGSITAGSAGGLVGGGSTEAVATSVAWNTTTYPAAAVGSGTAGIQFAVDTRFNSNLVFRFDTRHSNSSSRFVQAQYTTDGIIFSPLTTFIGNLGGDTWYNNRTVDLSEIPGVNAAAFAVRIVSVFNPDAPTSYIGTAGTYATSGTLRYDAATLTSGHVWIGSSSTSITDGTNFSGGLAPTTTSTVLLGIAGVANPTIVAGTGGTTLDQIVTQSMAPAYTLGGVNAFTLNAGLVHGATNVLTVNSPLGFGQSNTIQNRGTVDLNGAVGFTNFLNLQGGRVNINGTTSGAISSITSGNPTHATVRVAPGTTLGGTGTISQIVTVTALSATNAGVITAGTPLDRTLNIGTTITATNLSIGADAAYDVKIFNTGTTDNSLLAVIGNVSINPTSRLTLDLSAVSPTALRSAFPLGHIYTVITGTGASVNNFAVANLSYSNLNGFTPTEFSIVASPSAGTVQIQFAPIPEPTVLLGLGLAGVVFVRRRR
jgi:fibronectin-binding autotransporter adhesin